MARKPSFPRIGEVYLVQLDPTVGREIKKTRPAVVVSNDHMNELSATVLVMPITAGHYKYYHWVKLKKEEGGLLKRSSVVTEQIRAVDKRRLTKRLGKVHKKTLKAIQGAIKDHFDL